MRKQNSYIGSKIERVEDSRFLTGRGTFIGDLTRQGQLHAVVLRSTVAHGKIGRLDFQDALAMPGIVAVITAADIGDPLPVIPSRRPIPSIAPFGQAVIVKDRIRYVGEPLALIVAENQEQAEDARERIEVEVVELPAIVTCQQSLQGDTLLVDEAGSNVAATFTAERGDVDRAFEKAHYVQKGRFSTQRQTALPLECRGLLAEWDDAARTLTMHGAAKLPFFNRRALAGMMGIDEAQVEYVEIDVGGGFGARGEFYPEDFLTAFAARRLKRPVKWLEDRQEHFMAIGHSRECESTLEVAFDKVGTILGVRGEIHTNVGAYMRPNGTTPPRNAAQLLTGPYRTPSIRIQSFSLVSNKTPSGTYRGPGFYESSFFFERLLDKASSALGIDAVDLRRRNLITAAELPHELWVVQPDAGWDPFNYDSGNYPEAFEAALAEANWYEKSGLQGKLVDGRYHGLGVASYVECGGAGPREHVHMRVTKTGRICLSIGSSSVGQGIETIMAQIAADALEVPMGLIEIRHGSTNIIWDGVGSFGSRATVMGGSAITMAAEELLSAFRSFAAERLGVSKEEITFDQDLACSPDNRNVTLAEAGASGLEASATYESTKPTFAYGTAVAHVTVDPGTGSVELIDYVVVDDVGRIINPLTVHGQSIGGAVQGLGGVFGENLAYGDDGQLLVGTLADYQLPHATDYPNLRFITNEDYPSPVNPLGAKGAGEGGIIPVPGAIANAIANALRKYDVQPDKLPLTPPIVWDLIQKSAATASTS